MLNVKACQRAFVVGCNDMAAVVLGQTEAGTIGNTKHSKDDKEEKALTTREATSNSNDELTNREVSRKEDEN